MSDELTVSDVLKENIPEETQKEINDLRAALKRFQTERNYAAPIRSKSNTLRFAVISDLHSGSLYERFDALKAFIDVMDVQTLLIAGDLLDGHGIYRGQEFEIYAHGVQRQLNVLEEKFPKQKKPLDVYFITGNHDYSFDKLVGVGIGNVIAERMGWTFLGQDSGTVPFETPNGPYTVELFHPDGGTAYAVSYRAQKIVESLAGGTKPDMLILGHYHKALWMPMYRNVSTFLAGAFQSQTPFMARKSSPSDVGGWIMEVTTGGLVNRVRPEFISFYEPEWG
jgi:predicted phosphodiesterase